MTLWPSRRPVVLARIWRVQSTLWAYKDATTRAPATTTTNTRPTATNAMALPRTRSQFDRWPHRPPPKNASSAAVSSSRRRHSLVPNHTHHEPSTPKPSDTRPVIVH